LFVSPVTVQVPLSGEPLRLLVVHVLPSGLEVTVKEVGVPPVPLSCTVTWTAESKEVPLGFAGASGAGGCGVTDDEGEDALLVP